jgi:hypothetical protein
LAGKLSHILFRVFAWLDSRRMTLMRQDRQKPFVMLILIKCFFLRQYNIDENPVPDPSPHAPALLAAGSGWNHSSPARKSINPEELPSEYQCACLLAVWASAKKMQSVHQR